MQAHAERPAGPAQASQGRQGTQATPTCCPETRLCPPGNTRGRNPSARWASPRLPSPLRSCQGGAVEPTSAWKRTWLGSSARKTTRLHYFVACPMLLGTVAPTVTLAQFTHESVMPGASARQLVRRHPPVGRRGRLLMTVPFSSKISRALSPSPPRTTLPR